MNIIHIPEGVTGCSLIVMVDILLYCVLSRATIAHCATIPLCMRSSSYLHTLCSYIIRLLSFERRRDDCSAIGGKNSEVLLLLYFSALCSYLVFILYIEEFGHDEG